MVELPYGNSEKNIQSPFGMAVLLPEANTPIDDFVASLDINALENGFEQLNASQIMVSLRLPRFSVTYEKQLNEDLQALGMQTAFSTSEADFSFIQPTTPPLYVSSIIQKNHIEITEAGTEAAAVTWIEIDGSPPVREIQPFHANRPFLFFIREHDTGAILFAGIIRQLP